MQNCPEEITNQNLSSCRNCLWKHIPNTLTVLRLLSTPLSVWAIVHNHLILAFWIFFTASVTDWFDGYLARRWQMTSKLGQILDPLADKLLIVSVSLTLGLCGYIPLWLPLLILGRDCLILAISGLILIKPKGIHTLLEPRYIGKVCTTFQMLFIGFTLMSGAITPSLPTPGHSTLFMVTCLYSVAAVTIASGLVYARIAYHALHK